VKLLDRINPLSQASFARCRVPDDLRDVTCRGPEVPPAQVGATSDDIEALWGHIEAVYRTGMHPAIQVCVRREGEVALNRAIGHRSGNSPTDSADSEKHEIALDTRINIFSATKCVTAMLVHKLAAQGALHLEDRVCDHIPEFARYGKHRVTIRHLLAHRAGLPNLPSDYLDLDLLNQPERVLDAICELKPSSRPGRILAYHAVTGGFVLGEVIRRTSGVSLREYLRREVSEPLGLTHLNYAVSAEEAKDVAINAFTGPPPPPPLRGILKRAIGASLQDVVTLSNDPRFLTGILPSASMTTNAEEMATLFQCLLDGGEHEGAKVFEPRSIRHAIAEQSWWEIDFTLIVPIRYGLGFMLGNKRMGPFGGDTEHAFGHVGLSNVFCWADPERQLSVALLSTGKPIAAPHVVPLFRFINGVGRVFGKIAEVD
jgi:CubicO group peptidase (beta-lactamase class C family)